MTTDWTEGFRFPAEVKYFSSSLCDHTSSEAHQASYSMDSGGPFPGGKAWPRRDADHSTHLVPRSKTSTSYVSFPPWRLVGDSWRALLYFTLLLLISSLIFSNNKEVPTRRASVLIDKTRVKLGKVRGLYKALFCTKRHARPSHGSSSQFQGSL
jgi:hypothetical protein